MRRQVYCVAMLLYMIVSYTTLATTFTVNNLNDAGVGSLRQAITDANADNTATVASPHIIDATGVSGTINIATLLPTLNNHISIMGPGAASLTVQRSTVGGTPLFTVFTINTNKTVLIRDITISNGYGFLGGISNSGTLSLIHCTVTANNHSGVGNYGVLTIDSCSITGNDGGDGGGVWNWENATATVRHTTISNNSVSFNPGYGAGVYNRGTIIMEDCSVTNNTQSGFPGSTGGIYNYSTGSVELKRCVVSGNTPGSGIGNLGVMTIDSCTITENEGGDGGGVWNWETATVTITNSTITNNYVPRNGSAIYNRGTATVDNCIIADNIVAAIPGATGGIYNTGTFRLTNSRVTGNTVGSGIGNFSGTMTIDACVVSHNTGGDGGGIWNWQHGTLFLTNSTLSDNSVARDGGGLYNRGAATIMNTTIARNRAPNNGGGVYSLGTDTLRLIHSTVANDTANALGGGLYVGASSPVSVMNTILAGNTGPTGPDAYGTAVISRGHNLVGKSNGSSGWLGTDILGTISSPVGPLLGPLQNNGGPTETMALLSGSPAIDAGDDAVLSSPYSLMTDQRGTGFARKSGSHVDIGAFEFGSVDTRLPVELTGFTLSASNHNVRIAWRTASEVNNLGFEVQRASDTDPAFHPIASYLIDPELAGLGTSSFGKDYAMVDAEVLPGVYRYRLIDVSTDGVRTEHSEKIIRIEEDDVVTESVSLRLNPVSPNPVHGEVQVSFVLPEPMAVTVEIYDVSGTMLSQPIRQEMLDAGNHVQLINTQALPNGVYTIRLIAGDRTRVQTFVVMR